MLTAAWHTFFSDYVAMTLVAVFVPGIILALINMPQQILVFVSGLLGNSVNNSGASGAILAGLVLIAILGIATAVVRIWLQFLMAIGATRIQLDIVDGKEPTFRQLFNSEGIYWRYLWTSVLYGLLIIAGLILFIIPGIYWAVRYQMTLYAMVDQKLGVRAAFTRSSELTHGRKWWLIGFGITMFGVNILGLLVFFVGLIVTIPLTSLAHFYLYRYLTQNSKSAVAK